MSLIAKHHNFWTKNSLWLLLSALVWFTLALVVQHIAYLYVDNYVEGIHVGDLILDNIPSINLDIFIVQGALVSTLLVILLLLYKPHYITFSIKTIALLLIIRSFFMSLTHLGTNLNQITLNTQAFGFGMYDFLYNGKNDFFFSGHVGAAFLVALIFWKEKMWRNIFLGISIIFAGSMLLAHMHYSIDIFAAPFIVYGIFIISKKVFSRDYALLGKGLDKKT